MYRTSAVATAFALLLIAPATMAAEAASGRSDAPAAASEADCAAPPCGYINPILDLVFPEKLDCGAGNVLGAEPSPADCMTPPEAGKPTTLDGTLRWYWDLSYDGTYPADPSQNIEISFGQTSSHPSWLDFSVEPAGFTIDNTVLLNPQFLKPVEKPDGSQAVFFWYEQPISITFTRTGEPTEEDLSTMRNKDGVQPVFVKVKSTGSGTQFKEAYGIELFRFHGGNDESIAGELEVETPGAGLLAVTAAVGAAAVAARRRY